MQERQEEEEEDQLQASEEHTASPGRLFPEQTLYTERFHDSLSKGLQKTMGEFISSSTSSYQLQNAAGRYAKRSKNKRGARARRYGDFRQKRWKICSFEDASLQGRTAWASPRKNVSVETEQEVFQKPKDATRSCNGDRSRGGTGDTWIDAHGAHLSCDK
ncbi:uncharacterized protein LOC143516642 [Brachyhypopomus gauderio]|uniref:uncharacterized protein LOC143516642 n=1 Tax=Brachyhypopomus gauderio TaxID=698409 RepID=UPI0040423084